jgi:radical SAM protein with 4Fe4S-binding SPASM domain
MMNKINPFANVYAICDGGTLNEKIAKTPPFPYFVDIELANVCYLNCEMCPTGAKFGRRAPARMAFGTAKKIVDECAKHRTPIRLIGWGEPTQSDIWAEVIFYARSAGILVHMNTNGQWLLPIHDVPRLDSLKFSLQGYDCVDYAQIRRGAQYARVVYNVYRTSSVYPETYITVGTTVYKRDDSKEESFRRFWLAMGADEVVVGDTRDLREVASPERQVAPNCPEMFGRLTVHANGDVTPCCSDFDGDMVVGNVDEESLQEIWESNALCTRRHNFLAQCGNNTNPCRRCDL